MAVAGEFEPVAEPGGQGPGGQEPSGQHLRGLGYFKKLLPLLRPLHLAGCDRDKAANRTLHYDQYICLILLQLFNPAVATLRLIQQASQVQKVQQILGCARTSLGSLSEAPRVFDPDLLLGVIGELAEDLKPLGRDPRLAEVKQVVTLVDGTLLKALPQLAEAMWLTTRTGTRHAAWRMHTHFDLDKFVPTRVDLSDGRNSGKSDEKNVLRRHLVPDHCYVMAAVKVTSTFFLTCHLPFGRFSPCHALPERPLAAWFIMCSTAATAGWRSFASPGITSLLSSS